MSREPLDMDMGDDDQADDIVEYERYVEDPPADYVIRNREADDNGDLGITQEVDEEWTEASAAAAALAQDERPAEVAAVRIVGDDGVDGDLYDRDDATEDRISGEYLADELDL
ncbi:hypothetical protein ACFXK0_11215 [Nocardia sp. NPDC059177]|uniref:hypothetical protein n=1 Tax=Nocardia sp. NPDC059177 TaxID=3346759 RepID=UPI0036CC27CF